MITKALTLIKTGAKALTENPQLLLTVSLVIIIPLSFLFSGQQFLSVSRDNQERLIKDKVGVLQDALVALASGTSEISLLEEQFIRIAEQNPDILRIAYVSRVDEIYTPLVEVVHTGASTQVEEQRFYALAAANQDESVIFTTQYNGERRWQSYRYVPGSDNSYIYTEMTLAQIDALFTARVQQAYLYLVVIIGVIVYLLFRHLRIIDYGHLYKKLKESNKTRDLFTNMITHELRAPLTAMRGYASMIRENKKATKQIREQATTIETSSERLVGIVSDLLDVARIQSGRLKVEREEIDVKKVADEAIETLRASAKEKQLELQNDIASDISLKADRGRLIQVLTNVISNAIKYTEEGSITLTAEKDATTTTIRVKDTGIGISYKDQQKLFEPFERVDEDVAHITGTGLGMWITKELVTAMDGEIGIESIKGVGTQTVIAFKADTAGK